MKKKIRYAGTLSPGVHRAIFRDEDGSERTIAVREPRDGVPLQPDESILLAGRETDKEGWQDLTVVYRGGPAQVATPAYREGYDRIFGKKTVVGEA